MERVVSIGIDPSDARQNYSLAALDEDKNILALSRGRLDDVLSFAAGQTLAVIAIHIPTIPLMDPNRNNSLKPLPQRENLWNAPNESPSRSDDFNSVRNPTASITQIPASRKTETFRKGLVLREHLAELGYVEYQNQDKPRVYLGTNIESACDQIFSVPQYTDKSLEGRLQRQVLLAECGVNVIDPMVFFEEVTRFKLLHGKLPLDMIYKSLELNALICSFVAWSIQHSAENMICKSDVGTESIWLPGKRQPLEM
jgi:hypothetical protein